MYLDEWEEIEYLIGMEGKTLEVTALYHQGMPETWSDPGSDPEIEILSVINEETREAVKLDGDDLTEVENAMLWRHEREIKNYYPCRCGDRCRC